MVLPLAYFYYYLYGTNSAKEVQQNINVHIYLLKVKQSTTTSPGQFISEYVRWHFLAQKSLFSFHLCQKYNIIISETVPIYSESFYDDTCHCFPAILLSNERSHKQTLYFPGCQSNSILPRLSIKLKNFPDCQSNRIVPRLSIKLNTSTAAAM